MLTDPQGRHVERMTQAERELVFAAVDRGDSMDAVAKELNRRFGRPKQTAYRLYRVVRFFRKEGDLSNLNHEAAERAVIWAKYGATISYVENAFDAWQAWHRRQRSFTNSEDPQVAYIEHWPRLQGVATQLVEEMDLFLFQLMPDWSSEGALDGTFNRTLHFRSEGENERVEMEIEENDYFRALRDHLPDDLLWRHLERWKQALCQLKLALHNVFTVLPVARRGELRAFRWSAIYDAAMVRRGLTIPRDRYEVVVNQGLRLVQWKEGATYWGVGRVETDEECDDLVQEHRKVAGRLPEQECFVLFMENLDRVDDARGAVHQRVEEILKLPGIPGRCFLWDQVYGNHA